MVHWQKHRKDGGAKKCFVISPIGEDGSDQRRHADAVFKLIISEALVHLKQHDNVVYEAERADHRLHHGKIMDDVIENILHSDVVIAVLTFARHNVYYELGIAHAAGRSVILLLADTEQGLPFDLKDYKYIKYNYDPVRLRDGEYSRELADLIRSSEAKKASFSAPFGSSSYKALGGEFSHLKFYPSFSQLKFDDWRGIYRQAQKFIAIYEPWLEVLRSLPEEVYQQHKTELIARASSGVRVTILYSTPQESTSAARSDTDRDFEATKRDAFISRVESDFRASTVRVIRADTLKLRDRYTITDIEALIIKYSVTNSALGSCPTLAVSGQPENEFFRLYKVALDDVQEVARASVGKEFVDWADLGAKTTSEPRHAVFEQALHAIQRATTYIVVLEPTLALFAPAAEEGDDAETIKWRKRLRNALLARAIDLPDGVLIATYSPNNPLFDNELKRYTPAVTTEHAFHSVKEAWEKVKGDIVKEQEKQGKPTKINLDLRFDVEHTVISERVLLTESSVLAVSLISRVGYEECAFYSRERSSREWERMDTHVKRVLREYARGKTGT